MYLILLLASTHKQDKIDRIDEILRTISQQLELILTEIQNTQCYISNSNVDGIWNERLKPLWYRYTIGKLLGALVKGGEGGEKDGSRMYIFVKMPTTNKEKR